MPNPEGFTEQIERICEETCADFGDPPCWMLPDLVEPCGQVTPCDECLAAVKAKEPKE